MKWKKYTVHTTVEAEDLVAMMLMELGVEGVQIEDKVPLSEADTKGMFVDMLPDLGPDDGKSALNFFLHLKDNENRGLNKTAGTQVTPTENKAPSLYEGKDLSYSIADRQWGPDEIEELIKNIRSGLSEMESYTNLGNWSIEESGTSEDIDWLNSWKKYFKPFKTGVFLIKPSWEEVPEEYTGEIREGKLREIDIDPGTAFGTGSHETTRLCLNAVAKYVRPGVNVLDIGTGSGILGIAALKCGASFVCATELDPQCSPSINCNLKKNGLGDGSFRLFTGNILDDPQIRRSVHGAAGEKGTYKLITANILAPVIGLLAGKGQADEFISEGGIFICSGIIDEKLPLVEEAFNRNPSWRIEDIEAMGEWRLIAAVRV